MDTEAQAGGLFIVSLYSISLKLSMEGLDIMEAYQLIAIVVGGLGILSIICGVIVYLVRKNDKVVAIAEKMPDLEALEPRIIALEDFKNKYDNRLENFRKEQNAVNSLLFEAIKGIAREVGANDVVTLIDDNTMIMASMAKMKKYDND